MKNVSKTGLCVAAILGVCSAVNAEGTSTTADVVAVGPVELVEDGHVTVLGRAYDTQDTSNLTAGDKVAVHGALQADGSVKNVWIETLGSYQAGSDPVFETGTVTTVNPVFGRLTIGGSEVDYTAALAEAGANAPSVGEVVTVYGTQPESGGVVLGETTHAQPQAVTMAMGAARGVSAKSITGGGVGGASITGGGVGGASITGGGVGGASITGGGVGGASITGGGVGGASITGGGIGGASITGGGVGGASITGGGIGGASITGGGAPSI